MSEILQLAAADGRSKTKPLLQLAAGGKCERTVCTRSYQARRAVCNNIERINL